MFAPKNQGLSLALFMDRLCPCYFPLLTISLDLVDPVDHPGGHVKEGGPHHTHHQPLHKT